MALMLNASLATNLNPLWQEQRSGGKLTNGACAWRSFILNGRLNLARPFEKQK
jgi:hypothetical protein